MNQSSFTRDLLREAPRHVQFLRQLHALGVTLTPPSPASLIRYTQLWLPMVASQDEAVRLIPPADVAWLWHCHRLAPEDYKEYSTKNFGKIVEANPPFSFQSRNERTMEPDVQDAAELTQKLWGKMFVKEYFFLVEGEEESKNQVSNNSVGGFDLLGSTHRQATFLWQISGPRFQEEDFLREGLDNYFKFLQLTQITDGLPQVPTFQIDLMWHTHILASIGDYTKDCRAIRGGPFHHDDSLDNREPGGELDRAFKATCASWEKAHGVSYIVAGGMYRGEPPLSFYDTNWDAETYPTESPVIVAGSFSAGDDRVWLDVKTGKSNKGDPAFLTADTSKKKKDHYQKVYYVFGLESEGLGYYHVDTKEAGRILHRRLKKQEKYTEASYNSHICFACGIRSGKKAKCLEAEHQKAKYRTAAVKARYEQSRPTDTLSRSTVKPYYVYSPWEAQTDLSGKIWCGPFVKVDTILGAACGGGCGGGGGGRRSGGGRWVGLKGGVGLSGGGGCGGGGCGGCGCGGGC